MDKRLKLWIALWASTLVMGIILIPSVLVNRIEQESIIPSELDVSTVPEIQIEPEEARIDIPVYLTTDKRIATMPLEHYVKGVLAAEMPIEFELEALKAQAIAARTYVLRRIVEQDYSNVPVEGAIVTDSISHQVYFTDDRLKNMWDHTTYEQNMNKINQAVNETKGLIATFEERPINATFFSTSNGYTENSEDYWNISVPYLRSVPSPWDAHISPRYEETVSYPSQTVFKNLGLTNVVMSASSTKGATNRPNFKILETTDGNRIKSIIIGDQTFTGREVREKLGLNSSQFQMTWDGDHIKFTTYGYGHGVGMSQWGANGMAMEGKLAEDIIKYYYQGVKIEQIKHEPLRYSLR